MNPGRGPAVIQTERAASRKVDEICIPSPSAVMVLPDSTADLVDRFMRNPGDEDERFEVKAKGKMDSKAGRINLVSRIGAMANTYGGTMLVGLQHDGDAVTIQGFNTAKEEHMHLRKTIANHSKYLEDLVVLRWAEHAGKMLLRIDVRRARGQWVYVRVDGQWACLQRRGSDTEALLPNEALARSQTSSLARPREPLIANHELPPSPKGSPVRLPDSPPFRTISETDIHCIPLFTSGIRIEDWLTPAFYHTGGGWLCQGASEWEAAIALIHETLQGGPGPNLTYSIKQGRRVLNGGSVSTLLEDVADLPAVVCRLLAPPQPDKTHDARIRPLVHVQMPIAGGFVWLEAECSLDQEVRWGHESAGIVLQHIPMDSQPYLTLLQTLGGQPLFWEGNTNQQGASFRGEVLLEDCRLAYRDPHAKHTLLVEATNPWYGDGERWATQVDTERGSWLAQLFAEIPRILVQVRGGAMEGDRQGVLDKVELLHVGGGREEILAIHALGSIKAPGS